MALFRLTTPPRVAFFADSLYEDGAVSLTSREFQRYADQRQYPFFALDAGLRPGLQHYFSLRRKLAAFRPSLVHVAGLNSTGLLGALLAGDLGVPLVASSILEPRRSRFETRFYRLARLLFATTPELVASVAARTGRPTRLLRRGIDTTLFSPSRRKRSDAEFVVGFAGPVLPDTDVRVLAALEKILREAGVRDYRFLIAGDGAQCSWLARNLERVTAAGALSGEALADAYANMDVLLSLSPCDAPGDVVLEAMASGVPVIVNRHCGLRSVVQSRKNGYVAESLEDIAGALMDLRSHPSLRTRLAEGARKTAHAYSWEAVLGEVYACYQELQSLPLQLPAAQPLPNSLLAPGRQI